MCNDVEGWKLLASTNGVESSWAKIPGGAPEISFQVNKTSKRLCKRTVTMVTECFITISKIFELCQIYTYSVARR